MCVISFFLRGVVPVNVFGSSGPVIHPDKCSHVRAPEAFDILKKVRILSI